MSFVEHSLSLNKFELVQILIQNTSLTKCGTTNFFLQMVEEITDPQDIHTFIHEGIEYIFHFKSQIPYLGTSTDGYPSVPTKTSGRIVLPSHFTYKNQEYALTHVSQYSFMDTNIIELIFPETLQYLAPAGCELMKNVELIDLSKTKITFIGNYTFSRCYKLKRLLLPGTVRKFLHYSLKETSELKFIEISPKMTEFADHFCDDTCGLEYIYFCGEKYNNLALPHMITKVFVPVDYNNNYFSNILVNRSSFKCSFQTKCTFQERNRISLRLLSLMTISIS